MKNDSIAINKKYSFLLSILLLPGCLFAQPAISSFSPDSGPIGTSVTITGTGFSTTPSDNIVFFGAVKAAVVTAGTTSLTVTVPAGANFMPISVTVNKLTAYSSKPFIVTFPSGGTFAAESFAQTLKLTSSLYPYAVAISDLDGDGKPDLAAPCNANVPSSSVSVFRNTSAIAALSFESKIDVPIADMPYSIATGDLDGDGKPDLAVTYISGGGNVSIYKNTSSPGTLSFATPITYESGANPYKVLIADMDKDGKPDLVIANYLAGNISVLRNTTSGNVLSFASKVDVLQGTLTYSLCVGDFDGDGKNDMATVGEQTHTLSLFRNTSTPGTISFTSQTDLTTGTAPLAVTAGDVDGDGKTDIAVTFYDGFSVFRNTTTTSSFSFSPVDYSLVNVVSDPYDIVMSDLDGDAKPDLAIAQNTFVSLSKNNSVPGSISFAPAVRYYDQAFRVTVGDLDGDAKPDIVTPDFTGNTISVVRNKITEPYISSFTPAEAVEGESITITGNNLSSTLIVSFGNVPASAIEIVNDHTIKAVVAKGASGEVTVTNTYGTGTHEGFIFHAPPVIDNFTPSFGKTGDTINITGSYFTDATAVTLGGTAASSFTINSSTSITAVVNNGATGDVTVTTPYGTVSLAGFKYYPPPAITSFTPTEGDQGTAITITGTNLTDASQVLVGGAAVTSFIVQSANTITAVIDEGATGSISITTPGGTTTSTDVFLFPPPVITSFSPITGTVGSTVTITGSNFRSDVNANQVYFGAAKAIVTSASRTTLTVQVPAGTTYAPLTVTVNNHTAYAAQPFNTTNPNGDTEITDTSFAWKKGLATDGDVQAVFMADIDGDGKSDIIYDNYFEGSIGILRNTSTVGSVSFAPPVSGASIFGTNTSLGIVVDDVNSDGKPDIIVNGFNSALYIYRNISSPSNILFASAVTISIDNYNARAVVIHDFDGDAKADIGVVRNDFNASTTTLSILRNTGYNGTIAFASKKDFALEAYAMQLSVADFDGDNKPDIAARWDSQYSISIIRNTSTPGNMSFTNDVNITLDHSLNGMTVADFNNDKKPDIATCSYYSSPITILKNISNAGTIAFVSKIVGTIGGAEYITAGQLNADGIPDIAIVNDKHVLLFRNTTTADDISFAPYQSFTSQLAYNWSYETCIGDVDGDGKPDVALSNGADQRVSIFRNQQGEQIVTTCSESDISITSNITGTNYQWQVNAGSGYEAITNDVTYADVNSASLKIKATPQSTNGYQYRCLVDGVLSTPANLVVQPSIKPIAGITSPDQVCANELFIIKFYSDNTPIESTLELWSSDDDGDFTYNFSVTYYGVPLPLNITAGPNSVVKKYFFVVKPPESVPCSSMNYSDTTTTQIIKLSIPVITTNGNTLTISNPNASASYTWQMQDLGGNWVNATAPATGTAHTVATTGIYRVMVIEGPCVEYSASQAIIFTGTDTIPAESSGIRLFPNPGTISITIAPLQLADKWETLDMYRPDGKLVLSDLNISNQTKITLSTERLTSGLYVIVMRRKEGQPVVMKFIKQ